MLSLLPLTILIDNVKTFTVHELMWPKLPSTDDLDVLETKGSWNQQVHEGKGKIKTRVVATFFFSLSSSAFSALDAILIFSIFLSTNSLIKSIETRLNCDQSAFGLDLSQDANTDIDRPKK